MSERAPILLRNVQSGDWEEGELIDGLNLGEVKAAQQQWFEFLQTVSDIGRKNQPYQQWDWFRKARYVRKRPSYRLFGVAAAEQMQGLMLVSDDHHCRLDTQTCEPMIYIDYLSVAPWNQRGMTETPRLSGVGIRLLSAAVRLSRVKGFAGRIGLHSLAQAESFYRHNGTTDL